LYGSGVGRVNCDFVRHTRHTLRFNISRKTRIM
jgi:hypothetical protein